MITKNLRINQLPVPVYETCLAYLNTVDSKDGQGYGRFLADDVDMRFNNGFFGRERKLC